MWSKIRRWSLIAIAVLLAVASVFGGGVATGWHLADHQAAGRELPRQEPEYVEVEVPTFGAEADVVMPDVRGLEQERAFQVLADAGVRREDVEVETRSAAGPPGVVVSQRPAFGAVDPGRPAMVVSQEATMPDAVGRPGEEVTTELEELGALVAIEYRYVPGESAGSVLSTTPEAGTAIPDEVTVELAESSSSVFLAAIDPVDGGCAEDETTVDGTRYSQSLICQAYDDEGDEVAWAVGRAAESLTGVIGVPDDEDPAMEATVEIIADGATVHTVEVGYGTSADVDVDVSGVLRLTMRLTVRGGEDAPSRGDVVLGDLRLEGAAGALDDLVVTTQ